MLCFREPSRNRRICKDGKASWLRGYWPTKLCGMAHRYRRKTWQRINDVTFSQAINHVFTHIRSLVQAMLGLGAIIDERNADLFDHCLDCLALWDCLPGVLTKSRRVLSHKITNGRMVDACSCNRMRMPFLVSFVAGVARWAFILMTTTRPQVYGYNWEREVNITMCWVSFLYGRLGKLCGRGDEMISVSGHMRLHSVSRLFIG